MKYTIDTNKSVQEIVDTITDKAPEHKFSVLYVHNIQNTLHDKGFELDNECQVLDICSAPKAHNILSRFIDTSMILPCKVSVYTSNNQTKISMINLSKLAPMLNEELEDIAIIIERELKELLDEIK